jgi:hypothetical protein
VVRLCAHAHLDFLHLDFFYLDLLLPVTRVGHSGYPRTSGP